jgi:succinylarginine dihydrolase
MTALTTTSQIEAYRLATLRSGLKLELKGMKRSGRSCYAILKQMGYTGTRQQVLEQVQQDLDQIKQGA